jgi:hypothetical protein
LVAPAKMPERGLALVTLPAPWAKTGEPRQV